MEDFVFEIDDAKKIRVAGVMQLNVHEPLSENAEVQKKGVEVHKAGYGF